MLRVIIADDHSIVTGSLSVVLNSQPDMQVVATAKNGSEAVDKCRELSPDIVLIDIWMPVMNGFEAAEHIKKTCPGIKIAILTSSESSDDIAAAVAKDADGYLLKDTPPALLSMIIRCICSGYCIYSTTAKPFLVDMLRKSRYIACREALWTMGDADRQIIKYLSQGKGNKEIAQILDCTEGMVKSSIARMIEIIRVENRAQLVMEALKHNII